MAFDLDVRMTGGDVSSLTIIDDSDYADEVGHAASNFDIVYILQILKDGVEVAVLSDIAGADATVFTPDDMNPPMNTYAPGEDGRYVLRVVAVPTYAAGVSYVYNGLLPVYVYDSGDGKIYRLLQSGTGQTPSSSPTYWEEIIEVDITDVDTLYDEMVEKYRYEAVAYISIDLLALWYAMIYRVHMEQSVIADDVNSLMNNREWKDTARLFLDHKSLAAHLTNENYDAIDDIFTRASALATKYA